MTVLLLEDEKQVNSSDVETITVGDAKPQLGLFDEDEKSVDESSSVVTEMMQKKLVKKVYVKKKTDWVYALDLLECSKCFTIGAGTKNDLGDDSEPIQPEQRCFSSDLVVVLDLDDCLVHTMEKGKKQLLSIDDDEVVKYPVTLLRPGLIQFLRQTATRYQTHVFTAAASDYADFVLNILVEIVGVPFAGRFYRHDCTKLNSGQYVKDLKSLPDVDLSKAVLVDNNMYSFHPNPSNGIPVRDFDGSGSDTSLESLALLLQDLEPVNDVRPILEKRFAVKAVLDEYPNYGDCLNMICINLTMEDVQL